MNHRRPTKEEGALNPLPPLRARVSLGAVHLARPVPGLLLLTTTTTTTGLLPPSDLRSDRWAPGDRCSARNLGQAAAWAPKALSFWKAHHGLPEIVIGDFCGLKTSAPFCWLCFVLFVFVLFCFFFCVDVWVYIKWQDVQ